MTTTSQTPAAQLEVRSRNTEIAVAVFRTVFLLIVLCSPQFMEARGTRGALLVAAVIAATSYNLALFVLHVRGLPFPRFIILIADVSLVSLWIYFCGPGSDRFFALYYAVVIVAGLWFGVGGALLIAVFASAQYVFAVTISPLPIGVARLSAGSALLQVVFLIVTAGVVSIVAEVRERERDALMSSQATLQDHWQRIRIARQIDEMLRPERLPSAPGLDIAFRRRPAAKRYLGDYYAVIPLGRRRWAICIADVAGKWREEIYPYLPLFVSALRLTARREQSPARVLPEVNREVVAGLSERIDPETFISICYVVLDLEAGRLTYANAGHEPPIVVPASGGEPVPLRGTGIVLGVLPEATYREEEIPLHTRDTLVLFTDGMTEVADRRGRLLGREGLMARIEDHLRAPSADAMAARIFEYVNDYGKSGQRRDDMTLLVIRVTAADVEPGGRGEERSA